MPSKSKSASAAPANTLPLKEYFSFLSYLGLLLTACLAILPRSTAYFYPAYIDAALARRSSADRPEHPLLTPFTASAVGTAAWVAAGVAITMWWWGGKMAKWWGATVDQKRITETSLATLGTAAFYALALHLLGAPANTCLRTILFALTLALLTAWPVLYALGIPSIHDDGIAARYRLTRLMCSWRAENARERALVYPIAGTLLGAWAGAVPIALDWDRPWQTYPLTPLVGSVLGFLAGGYASFAVSAYESLRSEVMAEQQSDAAAAAAAAAKAKTLSKKRKGGKAM